MFDLPLEAHLSILTRSPVHKTQTIIKNGYNVQVQRALYYYTGLYVCVYLKPGYGFHVSPNREIPCHAVHTTYNNPEMLVDTALRA